MKKRIISLLLAITCIFAFTANAFAAETRASTIINHCTVTASAAGSGKISVSFSVVASGSVSKIGAQSIAIYELNSNTWGKVKTYTESNSGMCKSSASSYSNTKTYSGTAGKRYKIVVTVFAEKDGTRDTRTTTKYVTAT